VDSIAVAGQCSGVAMLLAAWSGTMRIYKTLKFIFQGNDSSHV
jgi:hypothetical protein